jgi:hypothetical protein
MFVFLENGGYELIIFHPFIFTINKMDDEDKQVFKKLLFNPGSVNG